MKKMANNNLQNEITIEIDFNGRLLSINKSGIQFFSLPIALLENTVEHNYFFDLQTLLNIDCSMQIAEYHNKIFILKGHQYYLQIFERGFDENKSYILIIQPVAYLKTQLTNKTLANSGAFSVFCSKSNSMQKLIMQAKAFSKQKEPLLISGETGTGKDLLALTCHQYSQRGDKVFLALNCAAMPDEVVESELYGHAPGAYLGTVEGKKGFFEQANGGSVLLDCIDEMSFQMQTKLIRFINDGSFRRVGDDNEVYVDVRIICATKVDLFALVKKGKFREDLYYRLNVLPLHLPSLNDRKEDIVDLSLYFINEFASSHAIPPVTLTFDAQLKLLNYSWQGNVRELKNILYSALAQLNDKYLTDEMILLPNRSVDSESISFDEMNGKTLDEITKQFEKKVLIQLYKQYPSSRKLAKRLGTSHTAIANKLRDYGIRK